jgi:signal transduction histidine kinase
MRPLPGSQSCLTARWPRGKLAPLLASSDTHALWVLARDGALLLAVERPGSPQVAALPLALEELRGLLDGARPPHVFAELDGVLLELCGEPIPASLATAPSPGWLLVGRRWGAAHLATLSSLTEAEVRLAPADAVPPVDTGTAGVGIVRPLADWQGRTLRQVVVHRETPELALMLKSDAWQARVFLVFGLLVLVGFGFALNTWVLRPLAAIRESLARGETAPLAPLRADRTELGVIARLVTTSFAQRDKLREEVAERTRAEFALRHSQEELRRSIDERAGLGRDLHDGVIQSLYAAGMSLAGVRALLKPGQEEAAVRLEQSRAALNETIRDVRGFINGLEPESQQERSFSQAVGTLLGSMQSLRTFLATTEIDDRAAARLTLGQRAQSLQIGREAVSNALRHGKASAITVTLRLAAAGIEFEIRDNGGGFVPGSSARTAESGHGLDNFTQRAREIGAELVLHSEVGRGTSVRLIFPSKS